jgi:hypothetical protein
MFAYHHPHHAPAPGPAQAPPASHAINSNNILNNNNSSTNQQTVPMLPPTMPPDAAVGHPMAWGSAGYTTAPGLQPYAYMQAASYPPLPPPPPPTNAIGASGHQLAFGQWFPMAPSAPAPPLAPPFGAPGLAAFDGPFVTYPTAPPPPPLPPPGFGVVPQMYAPSFSAVPVWPHAAMASAPPVGPSAHQLGPGFVYPPIMPSASPSAVPAAFDSVASALPLSHQYRRPPPLQLAAAAPIQGAVSIHVAPSQNAAPRTAAATGDAHRISHTDSRTSTPQSLRSTTSVSSNSAVGRVQGAGSETTPLTPPAHAPVSVRPIALDPNLVRAPPPAGGGGGVVGDSGGILVDRFRTRLCRNHHPAPAGKQCPYRSRCMFAHGDDELRTPAMNFRDGLFTEAAIRAFQEVESARRRRRGAGAVAVTASVTSSSTRDHAPTSSGLSDQVSPYSTISDPSK